MRRLLSLLLLLPFWGVLSFPADELPASLPVGAASPPSDAMLLEGLSALHQGRFNEGQQRFLAFMEGDPADPRGHLFLAFCEWWKAMQLRGAAESPEMEFHLQEAIRLAQDKLDQDPGDPQTLATLGTGYIFLAQYRAAQRKVFRAAMAAKKGKSLLEQSLRARPDLVDSQFGLGAYNYYADKVSLLVKGLRTVLFLPGGDSERGLSQLEEVAEKGRYFRTEAHLLLAIIQQGRHERRYLESLEHLRAALALNPGSPVILMSIGESQIRLGRYPEAQETLQRAVEVGRASPDPDQRELSRLSRILLADSLDLSLHSREALLELQASLAGGILQPDLRSRALSVAVRAASRTGDLPTLQKILDGLGVEGAERETLLKPLGAPGRQPALAREIEPALEMVEAGRWEEADRALDELRRRYPAAPEVRLHQARVLFDRGRFKEAEERLKEISAGALEAAPGWVRGWRDLYLGRSISAQGRKTEGRAFYAEAEDTDGFRAKDLARALLGPEGDDPGIWPSRIFGLGIQKPQDPDHVRLGFPEGGNAPVPIDRLLASIVGRQRQADLPVTIQ